MLWKRNLYNSQFPSIICGKTHLSYQYVNSTLRFTNLTYRTTRNYETENCRSGAEAKGYADRTNDRQTMHHPHEICFWNHWSHRRTSSVYVQMVGGLAFGSINLMRCLKSDQRPLRTYFMQLFVIEFQLGNSPIISSSSGPNSQLEALM